MSIAAEISRIQSAKADIKTAIEAKGVTVPSSATIDTYDDYVSQISSGGSSEDTETLIGLIERNKVHITIPSGTTSIGDYAFIHYNALTSVTIPNSVTSIGKDAFLGCSGITSIDIPSGVTSIDTNAFRDCNSLTSIDIPNSVTSIGMGAFYGAKSLTSITIPDSVTSIGGNCFYGCSGDTSCSLSIGSGITSISNSCFQYAYIISGDLVLSNNIQSIGNNAFQGLKKLETITIGSGITSIGKQAFYGCTGLTSITINATTPPTLSSTNAFTNTNNCPIYVPAESVSTYQSASGWSTYADRIQAIPNS